MLLKGDPGYYAEDYAFEGSKFKLRELDDPQLVSYIDASEAQGQETLAMARAASDGASPTGAVTVERVRLARELIDDVVKAGVVGWDLRVEFSEENVLRLPLRTRKALSKRIIAISTLGDDERPFSGR